MCEKKKPSMKKTVSNLSQPMGLGRKIYLVLINNFSKIIKGSKCCGHPGEPGC